MSEAAGADTVQMEDRLQIIKEPLVVAEEVMEALGELGEAAMEKQDTELHM